MMDYKKTLNLPKTGFPMKADLPQREPLILQRWQEIDLYRLLQEQSAGKESYILHDGPPYANGNIHIGHALNKTLKDMVVKYKTMRGYASPFVPGWDCHGLPVEHQLFKELKIEKSGIEQLNFRKKAYDYALKYVSIQKEEFKRLGVLGEWDNPYLTLSHDYEETIINAFAELVEKGYIYRGLKPVNWCYKCETALAEAEVEYEGHSSPSIFVKFRIEQTPGFDKDSYLLIWTTTPWTLLGNVAVAVHPDFTYTYLRTAGQSLIIANPRLEIFSKLGISGYEVIREIKGSSLEGLIYQVPFSARKGKVVLADYVSGKEGSGLVHIAPGHGQEDYATGLKYKLDVLMPVDAKGNFDLSVAGFQGLNVYDANKAIIEELRAMGILFFSEKIEHSYPHCWRCKSPIIFRATKQWFLKIDHLCLRQKLLEAIHSEVRWIPAAGEERIAAMVKERPDWCLSRQRYWGVPLPALLCKNCGEEFLESSLIRRFARLTGSQGSDCWFSSDLESFLDKDTACPYCSGRQFIRGTDILDVWFDSGVSHQAVLKKRKGLQVPCALYLEGSDQHRGWFQSSLIPSMCIDLRPPCRNVLTHGHVVDGEGRKMSKSLGNVIAPQEIIKSYGADIVRLWVASSDYNEDIRISPEIISRLTEAYRKIRNTVRFMLSNLYDFNPDKDNLGYDCLKLIDKWILFKLTTLLASVSAAYEEFAFHKTYRLLYEFCNEDLSMYYLDMVKGRLYTSAADSAERRAAQTAIYQILDTLVRLMAPILVFTAEEIWQHMPKQSSQAVKSVHLLGWPGEARFSPQQRSLKEEVDSLSAQVMALIPEIAKSLEEVRGKGTIGSSFDAKINLLTNDEFRYKYLESLKNELCEIFRVSQVEIKRAKDNDTLYLQTAVGDVALAVQKAEGIKCPRCWSYFVPAPADTPRPSLCRRCAQVVKGEKVED